MSAEEPSALTVEETRTYRRHVEAAAAGLRDEGRSFPGRGVVVHSEVGGLGEAFTLEVQWSAEDIPHFPDGTSAGTEPVLAVGTLGDTSVVVLEGGLSLYDGYTPREVVFPVRVLAEAGVDSILFANTAGSLSPDIGPGELVLATDHINFQGANPLVGPNVEDWGPRFPDMTEPYAASLRRRVEAVARNEGIPLREGIYFASLGPNRGTQAEYRMAQALGADVTGMTTVPEVIAARHMDVQVAAVSVITEQCLTGTSREDATRTASDARAAARSSLSTLLAGTLASVKSEEKSG